MTFNHEQIQERLVDFLSGELTVEARAAFDAHVASCEACRAEVNSFQKARNVARAVVRAPLGDAVPARARARVLEAAAAAVATHRASSVAAAAAGREKAKAVAQSPWFARWFQRKTARWTFPTFATVAAMAAFLLVRGTIFREAKQPLGEPPPADFAAQEKRSAKDSVGRSAPSLSPPSPPGGQRDIVDEIGGDGQAKSERREPKDVAQMPGKAAAAHHRAAARPSAARTESPATERSLARRDMRSGFLDELSDKKEAPKEKAPVVGRGGSADERVAASASKARPAKGSIDDLLEGSSSGGAIPRGPPTEASRLATPAARARKDATLNKEAEVDLSAPVSARVAAKPSIRPEAKGNQASAPSSLGDDDRTFAEPPPSVRQPAPRAAPPPAPRVAAVEESSEAPGRAPLSPSAEKARSTPPAASAPARVAKTSKKAEAVASGASAASSGAPASAASEPVASLVDKAEKLMGARRWSEAAAAYRELLRRFPAHAQVLPWRKRLATAEAAATAVDAGFASPPPPR